LKGITQARQFYTGTPVLKCRKNYYIAATTAARQHLSDISTYCCSTAMSTHATTLQITALQSWEVVIAN